MITLPVIVAAALLPQTVTSLATTVGLATIVCCAVFVTTGQEPLPVVVRVCVMTVPATLWATVGVNVAVIVVVFPTVTLLEEYVPPPGDDHTPPVA
jgi:hypothetical protein